MMSNNLSDDIEDAEDYFNQGDFVSARETFERILREASDLTNSLEYVCKFNIASCLAAEGSLVEALNQMLDVEAPGEDDFECTYNKALCLNKLGKPDLALSMISSAGAIDYQADESSHGHQMIKLLIDCLDKLSAQGPLSRNQAMMIEKLLLDYESQITAHIGEDLWNQNMGHVQFLIDCQFDKCLRLYETLLNNDNGEPRDNILDLDSGVLANLCVAYILTGRNRDAEELVKEVEEAERSGQNLVDDSKQISCSTRINLAISTLYCVKGNHEFGLARLIRGLEPIDSKLNGHSWQQASRCLLATLDKHCKQMICIKDDLFDQIVSFLIQCETHGIDEDGDDSIARQARLLRSIVLTIIHD